MPDLVTFLWALFFIKHSLLEKVLIHKLINLIVGIPETLEACNKMGGHKCTSRIVAPPPLRLRWYLTAPLFLLPPLGSSSLKWGVLAGMPVRCSSYGQYSPFVPYRVLPLQMVDKMLKDLEQHNSSDLRSFMQVNKRQWLKFKLYSYNKTCGRRVQQGESCL